MKKLPKLRLPKLKRNINYKKLAKRLVVLGAILLAISGYYAYNKLYLTNEKRFWLAIENSMSTRSVVRSVESGGTGNKTIETSRFHFGTESTVNRSTSVGSKSATSESNVTTQNILTPASQYVRYTDISTSELRADGTAYDFSSIKGIWAKQAQAGTPEEVDRLKLSYIQPHVTLVPFGNLRAIDRNKILKQMKDTAVYEIDFNNPSKQIINEQEYLIFSAKVKLKQYVSILQANFSAMGFGVFPPLNADNYPEKARYNVQFMIDPRSNVFAGIKLDNQTENYTNYGVNMQAPIPDTAIPLDQLQQQLQSLQ